MAKKGFKICASFDTETTNIFINDEWHAIPVLYIVCDLRKVILAEYTPDEKDEILFFSDYLKMLEYVDILIDYGEKANIVPVICAYNLSFDIQSFIYELNLKYKLHVNAQSSTNIYTLDILKNDEVVLRFWDTFHLEMNGLAAMGATCGFNKAIGNWDYSKIRTPKTPLTFREREYAKTDVQIIPYYLRYLLSANKWLCESMFANEVITKTSLVRQQARREIGCKWVTLSKGRKATLLRLHQATCKRELPKSYMQYALRKACFRGGFTFTSAANSNVVVQNVYSLDVVSMHHAFINGRYVPIEFTPSNVDFLTECVNDIFNTTIEEILTRYHKPFFFGLHVSIEFENIRLKKGTIYDSAKIALLAMAKFRRKNTEYEGENINEAASMQEENTSAVIGDVAYNGVFAFGKLYEADKIIVHVSEVELWLINRVYEFDSFNVLYGESTSKFIRPPDFVTLQSNYFFKLKSDLKEIVKRYNQGEPYKNAIPDTIHKDMREGLEKGTLSESFLQSYYNSTVKGMFNGIYGTQAQDLFKPDYAVDAGQVFVDKNTIINKDTFLAKLDEIAQPKVFYNYGLRIVGGSRMHLCIALELLHESFGDSIKILGGDTDSIKIASDSANPNDFILSLKPLHNATHKAIEFTQIRNRKLFKNISSNLNEIGFFEVENQVPYRSHIELWNKARVSIDEDGKAHVTCAGLSRPPDNYNIENLITDCADENGDEFALLNCIGFNTFYDSSISYALERTHPLPSDFFAHDITDYKNNIDYVESYEAMALYPSGRWVGELGKFSNDSSVDFLRKYLNREINVNERIIQIENNEAVIYENGDEIYRRGVQCQ